MMHYRKALFLSLVLLLFCGFYPAHASSDLKIPKVLGKHFDAQEISNFIRNRQLVLLHDTTTVKTEYGKKDARFVSTMVVIDTPLEVVRNAITNFEKYSTIHPSMRETTVTSSGEDTTAVKFKYEVDLRYLSPTLIYTLEYFPGEGNDLLWRRLSGDLNATRGRWEFERLSDNRTLLSYTGWGDFTGLGLAIDTILWAQPELKLAIPVSGSAVVVRNFREYLMKEPFQEPTNNLPKTPEVPLFSERTVPEQLLELTSIGTPMMIHPDKTIEDVSGEPLDLRFVSGMGILDAPDTTAKKYMTKYEKVPEFVGQVSAVEARETDTGFLATWDVGFGLGFLSVGFDYTLDYEWKNNQALVFKQKAGDLDHVYGAQEWIPYKNGKTIYFLTSAHEIGERAGYLVRLGNLIPNRQIAVGVAFAGIGVEKHIKWANKQIDRDQRESEPDKLTTF